MVSIFKSFIHINIQVCAMLYDLHIVNFICLVFFFYLVYNDRDGNLNSNICPLVQTCKWLQMRWYIFAFVSTWLIIEKFTLNINFLIQLILAIFFVCRNRTTHLKWYIGDVNNIFVHIKCVLFFRLTLRRLNLYIKILSSLAL